MRKTPRFPPEPDPIRRVDNGVMPTINLTGEVLSEVANAVSKIKADFFGRGPEGGKAYLNDDLLVVVPPRRGDRG